MIYIPSPIINLTKIIQGIGRARHFPTDSKKWNEVLDIDAADAPGLYIFSLKAGRGITPWYVGKASKQSLKKEIITSDKILKFNSVVREKSGTPMLTLLPRHTKIKLSLSKIGSHKEIDIIETMLIARCLEKNPNLINIQKTTIYKTLSIYGMLNSPRGAPRQDVKDFRDVIGGY